MEPEVDEEHVTPCSLPTNPHSIIEISTKQEDVDDSLTSDSSLMGKKEVSCLNEGKNIEYGKAKFLSFDNWGVNDFDNKPFSVECNATLAYADDYRHDDDGLKSVAANTIQTPIKSVENIKQVSPRLNSIPMMPRSLPHSTGFDGENATPMRSRSSPYHTGFDGENKRPRILCEFHAKGWCVRGKSCRFIHTRNGLDAAEHKNCLFDVEDNLSGSFMKTTEPSNYKTAISHDNWEPSIPFRPSHVITKNLLLKESLYDPILNSVEQTGDKNILVEYSNSGQRISDNNARLQFHGLHEEKLLNNDHVKETPKTNNLGFDDDALPKFDKSRSQSELHMDGSCQNNANDINIKREVFVLNESKAQKYFHAALVEFVKEIVKPTWREGLMSKDAHKIIVKKSVDKVMSTMQPHQIPNTAESIKSYLSLSQNKISKLVEGYIEKYGKS